MTKHTLIVAGLIGLAATFSGSAQTSTVGNSQLITWSCAGSPCPWGTWLTDHALVWPAAEGALSTRHGYATSSPVYLPAERANGATVWIDSGTATLYAGYPDGGSHRVLATLSNSNYFDVSGLAPGEVLSVQSTAAFGYQIDMPPLPEPEVPGTGTPSTFVTWACSGSPCPWGSSTSGHALVWPEDADGTTARLGYTASKEVYLGSTRANGTELRLQNGSATVYAGFPAAQSHRVVTTLSGGTTYTIQGVLPGEVVSVQSTAAFVVAVDVAEPPQDPPPGNNTSAMTTWACTASPCPWGSSLSNHALVWPTDDASNVRLGYTTSADVYLPASLANGAKVTIQFGNATIFAGAPGASSHRVLSTPSVGVQYTVSGLAPNEVLSVQSDYGVFGFAVELPDPPPPEEEIEIPPNAIHSIAAEWKCNIAACNTADWLGAVINWPSWAAYSSNGRQGQMSRTVYSEETGQLLYPYMGAWADGCHVTAYGGTVLIIEWERGSDDWRETLLYPGESYTIDLVSPEDGAMIETDGLANGFAVTLSNCTPQPL